MNYVKLIGISLLLSSLFACKANDGGPKVGTIAANQILSNHGSFKTSFNRYQLSNDDVETLSQLNEPLDIKVYFGTWCHDSKREVPRFMHLVQQSPNLNASYFALDERKSDPQGLAKKNDVRYTPTFIVYRNGKEIGRIIEKPKVSLARDIVEMLN